MTVELQDEPLKEILSSYQGDRGELIPILLEVQTNFGYLPEEAVTQIAGLLSIEEGEIYSVASFYAQFRLTPIGKRYITVCRGTACHIRGAPQILGEIEDEIGIKDGETRSDLEYTLESVACFGCCAVAPCIRVNDDVYGELNLQKLRGLFPTIAALNQGEPDAR